MKLVFERDFFRAAKPCYWGGFAGASGKGVSSLIGFYDLTEKYPTLNLLFSFSILNHLRANIFRPVVSTTICTGS
jgi:hypothetical protein